MIQTFTATPLDKAARVRHPAYFAAGDDNVVADPVPAGFADEWYRPIERAPEAVREAREDQERFAGNYSRAKYVFVGMGFDAITKVIAALTEIEEGASGAWTRERKDAVNRIYCGNGGADELRAIADAGLEFEEDEVTSLLVELGKAGDELVRAVELVQRPPPRVVTQVASYGVQRINAKKPRAAAVSSTISSPSDYVGAALLKARAYQVILNAHPFAKMLRDEVLYGTNRRRDEVRAAKTLLTDPHSNVPQRRPEIIRLRPSRS